MKIRLYNKHGGIDERTVPYDSALALPEIVYLFEPSSGEYKFFRKGYAANSTMFFETEALHVPEQ